MKLTSTFGKGALATTLALGTTLGTAGAAFAAATPENQAVPTSTMTTTNSYVRGAATRAAMPSIEILGLNSVEESGQFVTMVNGRPQYDWSQPKYYIDASWYNQNPSPLLANLATGLGTSEYPAAAYLSGRTGGGAGPNASLGNGDTAVWNLSPRLVVGTGGGDANYAAHNAIGVSYGFTNYAGLIDTMNSLAAAADSLTTATQGLRYGDAADIAEAYAAYINGTVDYIEEHREGDLPTVALVTAYEDGVYTIAPTLGQDGTASQNRYIETTVGQGLATNLNDGEEGEEMEVELADLQGVDLIMVGGQSGSSNFDGIYSALSEDGLLDRTYYVENNGTQGSTYGVTMNSVENAQNIGRILGMLYSDIIDQQSWLAYYYEEFYHIKSDDLAYVMSQALDGVRCAANHTGDLAEWDVDTAYADGWSHDDVARAIGVLPADSE